MGLMSTASRQINPISPSVSQDSDISLKADRSLRRRLTATDIQKIRDLPFTLADEPVPLRTL
jgi:hypothetical protein